MNLSESPLPPALSPHRVPEPHTDSKEEVGSVRAEKWLLALIPAMGIATTVGGVIAAGDNRLWAYLILTMGLATTAGLALLVRSWFSRALAREIEQARSVEDLRRAKAEAQAAWWQSPIPLFRADATGAWTAVNPSLCTLLRRTPEELIGDGWWRGIDRRDLAAMDAPWRTALAERRSFDSRCRITTGEGQPLWLELHVAPLTDAPGFCGGLISIDSEEQLRRDLAQAQEHRDLVLDGLNAAVFDWDVASGRIRLTRQWPKMLGEEPATVEASAAELETLAHPEDRGPIQAQAVAALNGATPFYHVEHRIRRGDGHWIWVESHGKVVQRAADGSALRMVGYNRDVTLRKRLEAALRDAEAHHARVLDDMSEVLFRTDAAGHFTYLNATWTELTGHVAEDSLGRPLQHFIHPEDRGEMYHLLRGLTDGRLAEIRHEIRAAGKDGFDRWLELRLRALKDDEGLLQGTAGTMHDVTERHRAELELRRAKESAENANRVKTDFLANVSQEVRTPLHGIVGMADLMLEGQLDEGQREHLQLIRASSASLLRTLNEVLDFSRIEAGKMGIELGEFPLQQALQQATKPHALVAARKGLNLRIKVANEVPETLTGDAKRLEQVLDHLLDNAVKFTAAGEVELSVLVRAELSERVMLEFIVRDTGSGFSSQQRENLFGAFSHAQRTSETGQSGVGLGLAICKRLAEMMGGEIWAESAPGRGSTFHFTARFYRPNPLVGRALALPAAKPREAAKPNHATGLTVLLVEDDLLNQKVAASLLRSLGHFPSIIASGAEAIVAWETTRFDLMLMDLQLPQMGSFEAARYIRDKEKTRGEHLPIIAMTAQNDDDDRARCQELAIDECLCKPIEKDALAAAVDRAAAQIKPRRRPAAKKATGSGTLDLDAALARVNNDGPMMVKILELFRERCPAGVELCRKAIAEGDCATLASAAHGLKGMAGTVGAVRLQSLAGALEKCAREARLADGRAALDNVDRAVSELLPLIASATRELVPIQATAS